MNPRPMSYPRWETICLLLIGVIAWVKLWAMMLPLAKTIAVTAFSVTQGVSTYKVESFIDGTAPEIEGLKVIGPFMSAVLSLLLIMIASTLSLWAVSFAYRLICGVIDTFWGTKE